MRQFDRRISYFRNIVVRLTACFSAFLPLQSQLYAQISPTFDQLEAEIDSAIGEEGVVPDFDLPDQMNFRVRFGSLEVAKLVVTHQLSGTKYLVEVDGHTIGIADALFGYHFLGSSEGSGNRYLAYDADYMRIEMSELEKVELRELFFKDGNAIAQSAEPELHTALDLEAYKNSYDPIVAMGYIMRPLSHDRLCKINVTVSDGYQAGKLVLGEPKLREDGRMECRGGFERLAGFSDEAMENPVTYFTVLYRQETASEYVIDRMVGKTPYGNFSLIRERLDTVYELNDEITITEDVLGPDQQGLKPN